jgi:hypothetical protein
MCAVFTWAKNSACKKEVRKMFFSEEKNQKTFIPPLHPSFSAMTSIWPRAPEAKVFWFFSSERNTFVRTCCPSPTNRTLTTGGRLG